MAKTILHTNDEWALSNPVDLYKYLNTELAVRIENILKSCGEGEENAIKMRQLKERLGCKDDRKIRLTIEAMRLSRKHIILSSNNGYWYCGSPEEARNWITYMTSYLKDISHMASTMEKAAKEKYGEKFYQTKMDFNWKN